VYEAAECVFSYQCHKHNETELDRPICLTDIKDELPEKVCWSSVSHNSHANLMGFFVKIQIFFYSVLAFVPGFARVDFLEGVDS